MGDVSADVVLGCARREIGAALLSVDGAPGVERALLVAELPRAGAGVRQDGIAVFEELSGKRRVRVEKDRQDIGLGVPEGMALIALPCQALGGDVAPAVSSGGLEDVEEIEAQPLEQGVVSLDLHIRGGPEGVERGALLFEKGVEVRGLPTLSERALPERRILPVPGGGIADALVKAQRFARAEDCFGGPDGGGAKRLAPALDAAVPYRADDRKAAVFGLLLHGEDRPLGVQSRCFKAAVLAGGVAGIVRVPLGDDGGGDGTFNQHFGGALDAGQVEAGRGELPARKADEADKLAPEDRAALRPPGEGARQGAGAHVEDAAMIGNIGHAEVQALPVGREDKAFRVHDVADGLVVFGIAVGLLAVDDGLGIEDAV